MPVPTSYAYTQADTVILFFVADGISTPRHAWPITAAGFLRRCWETCESSADACRAAGMSARAFSLFQSVGWFGYAGYPNSARPWQNKQLWDWSHCCSAWTCSSNRFFGLIGALCSATRYAPSQMTHAVPHVPASSTCLAIIAPVLKRCSCVESAVQCPGTAAQWAPAGCAVLCVVTPPCTHAAR